MKKSIAMMIFLLAAGVLRAQTESGAGNWKTWFITSGKVHRLQPPPAYKAEVAKVLAAQQSLDAAALAQVQYWGAAGPGYRWQELMNDNWMSRGTTDGLLARMLMSVAIYDATVAAWDTKYAYNRPRPFAADGRIKSYVPRPESPSYPCEYSVAAGAAVTVLAHYFPKLKDSVQRMAAAVMASRIAAGTAFPSDTKAGFELGQKIAAQEIVAVKDYMNTTPWDGKIPVGAGLWKGAFAMAPNAGRSRTVVLDSGSEFRPGPPPDYAKEMAELKSYKQNLNSMANAFYHATQLFWDELLHKKIFEYGLQHNPPQAARIYATAAIGMYDGFVACWDAKYAYWGIRPEQYDTTFKPVLFASPPFPGYPSGHAAISSTMAGLYGYFFPAEKEWFITKAKEVAESRFQGGIHFRSDNEVALVLGSKVAVKIIQRVKTDGASGR